MDRLWPRGLRKAEAAIDLWPKDIAPSNELSTPRKWFEHDPGRWPEFKKRYFSELKAREEELEAIAREAKKGDVTLPYQSKEGRYDNAMALKEYLEKRMATSGKGGT